MNWLFWNVLGINKRYKEKELRNYINNNHFTLGGIVETRVKVHKMEKIASSLANKSEVLTNY